MARANIRLRTGIGHPVLIAAIGLLSLALAVLGAWAVFGTPELRLAPPWPATETAPLPPLPAQTSTFNVSVSVPLAAVEDALNEAIPTHESGSRPGPAGTDIEWRIARHPVAVSAADNALRFSGSLSGPVRFVKDLLLDELAATFEFQAHYTAEVRPRLREDWRITPGLAVQLTVDQAEYEVLDLFTVSMRGLLQRDIDELVRMEERRLNESIEGDGLIERAARDAWERLCTSVQVAAAPEAWLEVVPTRVRATQPGVEADGVHLHLGLDARTHIRGQATRPACPFPDRLVLEDAQPGAFDVWLPIEVDYAALAAVLSKLASGRTFGTGLVATIDAVRIRPHGRALVLQIDLSATVGRWFSRAAAGSLYLLAQPTLDPTGSTITLADVRLDTASRNTLIDALGEAAEPWILDAFADHTVFDVAPAMEQVRQGVNEALASLQQRSSDGMTIFAEVDDVSLVQLDLGPEAVRVVAAASGRAHAVVDALPF